MSLVSHISGRFLRAPGSRLLSLITIFAGLGVILGVMVLDVTLAVMNGFRDQVQMTFVENMGWRQRTVWWRVRALVGSSRNPQWGEMPRLGVGNLAGPK